MAQSVIQTAIIDALGFPQSAVPVDVHVTGNGAWSSCFPVTDLATSAIASVGVAIQALMESKAPVHVDRRLASYWFSWSIKPEGWQMPSPWDAIAGDYRTATGWIKLHTNAPHHRVAALSVLGCAPERASVTDAVAQWDGDALEAAIVAAGGCAAVLRSQSEWAQHAQGLALREAPLIRWNTSVQPVASSWVPTTARPLAGLRVLDLTRVLAGPVATRTLAGFGADVLRIDPPTWDEPGVIPEVTLGKRCARLDLKSPEGIARLKDLMATSDIIIHGYRGDALARLGLDLDQRQAIRPGLIDVSLNAYGQTGPWAGRRGFDSLVQFSTGIAATGMAWRKAEAPVSLPVQALDYAAGYLLAATAIRGLIARREGSGPIVAQLSLARTARLLMDQQTKPDEHDFAPATEADYAPDLEATAWGPAQRLHAPLDIPGTPMHWTLPASALGSSNAVWAI